MLRMTSKTVFLVRHAESAENELMQGVVRSLNALKQFSFPTLSDMKSSVELASAMVSGASDTCALSLNGEAQVAEVRNWFLQNGGPVLKTFQDEPVLVAHSPMLRAKLTCEGLFKGILPETTEMIQLDHLKEITTGDYVAPSRWASAQARIIDFEKWISERPEKNIVVVGHSHYFKHMLGVDFKFSNCDVWKVNFLEEFPSNEMEQGKKRWINLERICGSTTAKATFGAEGPQAWPGGVAPPQSTTEEVEQKS